MHLLLLYLSTLVFALCIKVFEDVVDILDPEMNLGSDDDNDDTYEEDEHELTSPPLLTKNETDREEEPE